MSTMRMKGLAVCSALISLLLLISCPSASASSQHSIPIKVFTSPDDQFSVNSVIVEGHHQVMLVDAQMTKTSAEKVLEEILTIHLVLSGRTRGLVGSSELGRMKPTARLINASRGPIVDEQALIDALKNRQIGGAALDVFDIEPLPASHPFRTLDNVLATPHIGYVSHGLYETFYEDTVSNIRKWLDTHKHSKQVDTDACD
jgi:phosphoglycerate dehydrogenase-like enzyme